MNSDVPAAPAAPVSERQLHDCFDDEVVLLTGYPGERARALLDVLWRRERSIQIWLVIPGSQVEAAQRELSLAGVPAERLRVIVGEPCAIDLGLSREMYAELVAKVDRWFALYRTADPLVSRELGFRVNVGGAREVVELSKVAERLSHVTFLSNSVVFGDHDGAVGEQELDVGQSFPHPASESLAIAEAMLRRSLSDVPVSVVRTPQVVGARGGTQPPRACALHRLLSLVATAPSDSALPLPPGVQRPVRVLPADFVAEALYAVSALGTRGHVYHFADPRPPTLASVLERAAEHFGRRLESGGGARAFGRLLLKNPGFWLAKQRSGTLSDWTDGPELLTRSGDRLLERAGLRAPSLLDYLDSVLAHTEQLLRERKLEPQPANAPIEVVA